MKRQLPRFWHFDLLINVNHACGRSRYLQRELFTDGMLLLSLRKEKEEPRIVARRKGIEKWRKKKKICKKEKERNKEGKKKKGKIFLSTFFLCIVDNQILSLSYCPLSAANIDFVQDNIGECQDAIMQMEESKAEGEDVSLAQLIRVVNLEEARYLLESFLLFAIDKGLEASQKEASVKATEAELVQTRQNNVLQQQLLQ